MLKHCWDKKKIVFFHVWYGRQEVEPAILKKVLKTEGWTSHTIGGMEDRKLEQLYYRKYGRQKVGSGMGDRQVQPAIILEIWKTGGWTSPTKNVWVTGG